MDTGLYEAVCCGVAKSVTIAISDKDKDKFCDNEALNPYDKIRFFIFVHNC